MVCPVDYAGLVSRVSVSTAETQCPIPETGVSAFGPYDRDQVARALDVLFEFGFHVGCDGELLPPPWLIRGAYRKGA